MTAWNYIYPNLDIACNKLPSIKKMCVNLFSEETSCGSIRPPPVSDRSVFAFWVVAYGRFDSRLDGSLASDRERTGYEINVNTFLRPSLFQCIESNAGILSIRFQEKEIPLELKEQLS